MATLLKWIAVILLTGLGWLVAEFTAEYFKPYERTGMSIRKR